MATDEVNLASLKTEAEWQRVKLEEARAIIANESLCVEYDNGGGQMGVRKNPAFDAYNALMSNYRATLKAIEELSGEQQETTADPLEGLLASRS